MTNTLIKVLNDKKRNESEAREALESLLSDPKQNQRGNNHLSLVSAIVSTLSSVLTAMSVKNAGHRGLHWLWGLSRL